MWSVSSMSGRQTCSTLLLRADEFGAFAGEKRVRGQRRGEEQARRGDPDGMYIVSDLWRCVQSTILSTWD